MRVNISKFSGKGFCDEYGKKPLCDPFLTCETPFQAFPLWTTFPGNMWLVQFGFFLFGGCFEVIDTVVATRCSQTRPRLQEVIQEYELFCRNANRSTQGLSERANMFFQTVLLVLLLTYCSGVSYRSVVEEQWEQFKLQHKRTYANEDEEQYRMTVFMDNMHTILEHNKLYEMGISSYSMGMNQFGDLTDEEFHRYYSIDEDNEESPQQNPTNNSTIYFHSDKSLPKEVDWRLVGAVTSIKNQGQCGSCYAFGATGALEAYHFFKTKKLVSLSEQNIIDCTYKNKFKNNGCRGGRVDNSFRYIIENKGIDTEHSYPYRTSCQKCDYKFFSVGARMSSFVNLPKGNETALLHAIALIGPVAVMVDNKMKFYSGGIFDEPSCSNKKYKHGMLVIGYGTYKKLDYWLVKNSWGEGWGEMGYIMMVRNKDNQCAIATAAVYPVV